MNAHDKDDGMQDMYNMSRSNIWKNYGHMQDNVWIMRKGYEKREYGWMKESESQDQRQERMMNSRWKYGRSIRKFGMDGACPQCGVQVEEEK